MLSLNTGLITIILVPINYFHPHMGKEVEKYQNYPLRSVNTFTKPRLCVIVLIAILIKKY